MTEPPAPPSPEARDEAAAEPPAKPAAKRSFAPFLYAAGFIVLAAAIVWVWRNPGGEADLRVDVLAQQFGALDARVARLEHQPSPRMPELGPLAARVTALEQRPSPASQAGAPPDLAPLTARVTALEQRQAPDLAPLEARIAALEARQPSDARLIARVDAIDTSQRTAQSGLGRRMDADETRLVAIERSAGQVSALAERTDRLARILAAQLALDRGQALGDVPGAPPALARFAAAKPPTEASLRLAFPDTARTALAAARPATEGKPLLTRMWAEARDLVTVREGDRVLVGDPAAGVLDRARATLEAGDLAGAVTAVGSLSGPAADMMAGWLAQARSLLAARAALAEWAAHA